MPKRFRPSLITALAGFAVCACLFSWGSWLPLIFLDAQARDNSPLKYLHLLGSLGPALSGVLWAHLAGGSEGVARLRERILNWRVGSLWHAIAWGAPFIVLFAAQISVNASGIPIAIGSLGRSTEYPNLPIWIYWLAVLVFYGFGEEIGWRGFALPLLQSRLHPAFATLSLALLWALWHWPLFFFSPGLSSMGLGGVAGWFFSLITGAYLMTLLFNCAKGSVLIVAAFHATMDIAFLGSSEVMMVVGAITTGGGVVAIVWTIRRGKIAAIRDYVDT